jgi:hypothetical protein
MFSCFDDFCALTVHNLFHTKIIIKIALAGRFFYWLILNKKSAESLVGKMIDEGSFVVYNYSILVKSGERR